MKLIKLTRGKFAQVDDEDFEFLNQWKWQCDSKGYATRNPWNAGRIYMHRLLAKTPKRKFTDHIDSNTLNNQKSNLRVVTHHQNNMNRTKVPKWTSLFKGVHHKSQSHRGKPWIASIKYREKMRHIGAFDNEHHAALAYDLWSDVLYGKFGKRNFSQDGTVDRTFVLKAAIE